MTTHHEIGVGMVVVVGGKAEGELMSRTKKSSLGEGSNMGRQILFGHSHAKGSTDRPGFARGHSARRHCQGGMPSIDARSWGAGQPPRTHN